MVYEFSVTVPADTKAASPVELDALLDPGVITHLECEMAAGCHRLVHCVILEGAYQLYPRNLGGTMSTDAHVISFDDYVELKRGHNILKIRCWSPGTTYAHVVTVRFGVLPKSVASMIPVVELLTKIAKGMRLIR